MFSPFCYSNKTLEPTLAARQIPNCIWTVSSFQIKSIKSLRRKKWIILKLLPALPLLYFLIEKSCRLITQKRPHIHTHTQREMLVCALGYLYARPPTVPPLSGSDNLLNKIEKNILRRQRGLHQMTFGRWEGCNVVLQE